MPARCNCGPATAAYRGHGQRAWPLYERMLRAAWAGNVHEVLTLLREQRDRLDPPPDAARDDDPRRIVAGALA